MSKRDNYLSWDQTFMLVATVSAQRSKDPATQVGCCIVDHNNRVIGIGYNGLPRGCNDDDFPWSNDTQLPYDETKYAYVVHAEQNAILNSILSLDGATMYVTRHPCNECAKSIIQSGISTVIYRDMPTSSPVADMSISASQRMFSHAGVCVVRYLPTDQTFVCDY